MRKIVALLFTIAASVAANGCGSEGPARAVEPPPTKAGAPKRGATPPPLPPPPPRVKH